MKAADADNEYNTYAYLKKIGVVHAYTLIRHNDTEAFKQMKTVSSDRSRIFCLAELKTEILNIAQHQRS